MVESKSGFRFGPVSRTSFKLGQYLDLAASSKTGRIFVVFLSLLYRLGGVANTCGDRRIPCPPHQQIDCLSAAESPEETSLARLTCFPDSLWPTGDLFPTFIYLLSME